jgi:hypothetical protein
LEEEDECTNKTVMTTEDEMLIGWSKKKDDGNVTSWSIGDKDTSEDAMFANDYLNARWRKCSCATE